MRVTLLYKSILNKTTGLNVSFKLEKTATTTNIRLLSQRISYWHNPGTEPLKQLTVGHLVDKTAEKWRDRPALISAHQNSVLTFSETKLKVDELAQGLLEIGLSPGDHLGLWGLNTEEWYLTILAAAKVGIITVNINPAYQPPEVSYCISKLNVKALAMDLRYKTQHYYNTIVGLSPEVSKYEPCCKIKSDTFPNLTHLIVFTDKPLNGAFRLKDVFTAGIGKSEKRKTIEESLQAEGIWNVQFTSGTTGNPKGAMLTHFANINNAYFFGKRLGLHLKKHTICCQVPFFHVFGTVVAILCAMTHGATLVLPGLCFNGEESAEAIRKYKCTILYGTPTMYVDLCAATEKIVSEHPEKLQEFLSPEIAMSGGALCSPHLFKMLQKTFQCKIASLYGMTEAGPVTFQSTLEDNEEQVTSTVGTVSESVEIKVVDKDGNIVPMGQPGEVWFRSYGTMVRYWDEKQKTEEAITEDNWLKSGDQFILTEGGYGQVVGRIKDLIIRGGENIAPKEIEHLLEKHPSILEVCVYAISDKRMGEEIACSAKLKENAKLTKEDLQSFCKGKIAHFKIPKYIDFVSEFPKTTSGKIKKFELRKIAEEKMKMNY